MQTLLHLTVQRKGLLISLKSYFPVPSLLASFPASLLVSSAGGTETRGKDPSEGNVDVIKGTGMYP